MRGSGIAAAFDDRDPEATRSLVLSTPNDVRTATPGLRAVLAQCRLGVGSGVRQTTVRLAGEAKQSLAMWAVRCPGNSVPKGRSIERSPSRGSLQSLTLP
jgi:hypothetical protein